MIQEKGMGFLWDNTIHGAILAFEKFEAAFSLEERFDNPYCPEEVDLKAYILKPDGDQKQISGFWYEGFQRYLREDREVLVPTAEKNWRIRCALEEPGEYRYYVTLLDKKRHRTYRYPEKGELSFLVTPSERKGFLRVSAKDPAYLEFSDGSPYLGIGHNLCGWEWGGTDNRQGTYEYDRWLNAMAQNGANLAQFDFCEGDQIEWTPCANELPFSNDWKGLNYYNQQNAWKMDRRFQTAEELGIFFRLSLFHWEDFDDETENFPDWGWNRNPYNDKNGGPARNVSEFFEKQACKKYVRYYLKYVASRWGYSPNLMAYELWNEIDAPEVMWRAGEGYDQEAAKVISWHSEMGNYLKELDSKHLVTSSFADSRRDLNLWQLPCIDLTTVHRYTYFNEEYGQKQFDTEGALSGIVKERFRQVEKPVLFGEFALSPGGDIQKDFDPKGIEFHNQLWASLMLKSMATAMHWTWGSYVDRNRLYREYLPVSKFFGGEDLRRMESFSNLESSSEALLILGLKEADRAYMWIKKRDWGFVQSNAGKSPAVEQGCVVTVPGLEAGHYLAAFYDTKSGRVFETHTASAEKTGLELVLPGFFGDLAVKIEPQKEDVSWESFDFPRPKNSSGTEFLKNRAIVFAGGAGFCGKQEEYRFVYRRAAGNFQISARISSITNLGERVSAGLMIRESLDPESGYTAVLLHPYGKAQVIGRQAGKTEVLAEFDAGEKPSFCLTRMEGQITVALALYGREWKTVLQTAAPQKQEVFAGLTASSSHTITYITAEFDQLHLAKIEEETI